MENRQGATARWRTSSLRYRQPITRYRSDVPIVANLNTRGVRRSVVISYYARFVHKAHPAELKREFERNRARNLSHRASGSKEGVQAAYCRIRVMGGQV